jgi:hypothetical protein
VDDLPDFSKLVFPMLRPLEWNTVLPGASPAALDLLAKLVVYDPNQRLSAAEVPALFVIEHDVSRLP